MGDPRRIRAKFSKPKHPWQKERIEEEKIIKREYGLKNKSEIWRAVSKLKDFSSQAKKLIAARGTQSELETQQLLGKLSRLGLIGQNATLGDVLGLQVENYLDRRLQSILVKKKLARTTKQARQFITHGHIEVRGKKVTAPSYMVLSAEEKQISFRGKSALDNEEHPERFKEQVAAVAVPVEAAE
jgi:small subunit ribosomal protein S4